MKKIVSIFLTVAMLMSQLGILSAGAEGEDLTRTLPRAINGVIRVEAENYVTTTDTENSAAVELGTNKGLSFLEGTVTTYKIIARKSGSYYVNVSAAIDGGDAEINISANTTGQTVKICNTNSWMDCKIHKSTSTIWLNSGLNEVTVNQFAGGISFDGFTLEYNVPSEENTLEVEDPDFWVIPNCTGDTFVDAEGRSMNLDPAAVAQTTYRANPDNNASGGYNAGFNPGSCAEWLIDIESSGVYDFMLNYETQGGAGSAIITVDGKLAGNIPYTDTGRWISTSRDDWSSVTIAQGVTLDKGTHIVRFETTGAMTADCIKYTRTGDIPNRDKIIRYAETFNLLDGNGIGYYDTTSDALDADTYREEFAPVEVGIVNDKRVAVGMQMTEWLSYTVNVKESGFYKLITEMTRNDNVNLTYNVNGTEIPFSADVSPDITGGSEWVKYYQMNVGTVYLNKGDNIIKVTNNGNTINYGGFILDRVDFKLVNSNLVEITETVDGKVKAIMDLGTVYGIESPTLIAASYSDDRLSEAKCATADADGKIEIELDVTEESTVKMFLWDNVNNIKPMSSSKKIAKRGTETVNTTITCWGDSLTAGAGGDGITYPNVLGELLKDRGVTVYNMGVGGETAYTIAGRQGAIPMTVNEFTIPSSNTEKVEITFSNVNTVQPLLQGGEYTINTCSINGVEGEITKTGTPNVWVWEDGVTKYWFRRLNSGDEVKVAQDTQVVTSASAIHRGGTAVFFVGTNGPTVPSELIPVIDKMIEFNGTDEYLVVGLTSINIPNKQELEKEMQKKYGEKFLNLREYLSSLEAFNDAGITPVVSSDINIDDSVLMSQGEIPKSFLVDVVHFTAKGYEIIGNKIYSKLIDLGYIK